MRLATTLFVFVSSSLASCSDIKQANEQNSLKTGIWRATIIIQEQELPFRLEVVEDRNGGYDAYILNADERILLDEVNIQGDTVDIALHVFDANIRAAIGSDTLRGEFIKNPESDYRLPFLAVHNVYYRFKKGAAQDEPDFSGKYQVTFYNEKRTTNAIGVFQQTGDSVTGTFLTPTGDYRYLEGNVVDGTMQLSTFDGNHAYLFRARKDPETGDLKGEHFSGKTLHRQWTGIKTDRPELPSEPLTFMKDGYETLDFTFPDFNGNAVSLSDDNYKGKEVVVQLLGSWCPNCLDETRFLASWYKENRHRPVDIIGLAYERRADFAYASERVKKLKEKMDVPYALLIAGTNDTESASNSLPALNHVAAFPTTIFVGKDGKVKKIHTGFSGPGTGEYYHQYIEEFNQTINELLSEKIAFRE